MTDDDVNSELHRAIQRIVIPPGFTSRIQTHGFGASAGRRTMPLRAVVLGTAAVLLAVGVSARLVTLHWHPTGTPVAVARTHESPGAQATGLPTAPAPSAIPSLPAGVQSSASPTLSASSSATATVPACQATDLTVRVTTSSAQYTVGQSVVFTSTFTNTASHSCELPACDEGFNVTDASGHVVYVDSANACPQQPPVVFAAGASTSLGSRQIATGHMSAGTHTLMDRWGQSEGTATFVLVASGGSNPPPAPTPTPTPTATPLLP